MIRRLLLSFWLSLLAIAPLAAHASDEIEFVNASLETTDDGLRLSTAFSFDLTRSLEDALMRGVPLYFTTQVQISRPRWYWLDEVAVNRTRTVRIAYNVLTSQYRASVDGSLHLNFTRLDDMLALLRRPGRWVVAEAGTLKRGETYSVAVQMGLDIGQLPKPVQVSAISGADWRISSGWRRFSFKVDGK